MSVGKVLAFGAAGAAAWWFFFRTPAAAPGVTTSPLQVKPGANGRTLDQVYQAMLVKANGATSGSVDDWNSFLMQGTPSITAPDPLPLFTAATPGFDRSTKLTPAQYWAVMAPALKGQYGLTGLGFYASAFHGQRPRVVPIRRYA